MSRSLETKSEREGRGGIMATWDTRMLKVELAGRREIKLMDLGKEDMQGEMEADDSAVATSKGRSTEMFLWVYISFIL